MQLLIFIFASKSPSVSLQSHPEDTVCTSFQTKWKIQLFLLKFAQKMDLGFKNQHHRNLSLKLEKTNIKIRISILEKLSPSSLSPLSLSLSPLSLSLSLSFSLSLYVRANYQAKQTVLTFSAQICSKLDLRLEVQKTNIRIRISILEILYILIFRQNKQLWLFRSKFAQKWI